MLALGRFLQQASDDGAADRAVAAQVEQLVARVAEAVVLQDRRDALAQLRDLLTSGGGGAAAAAFGAAGFPLALGIVRDREDRELVQLALESLSAAVGGGTDGGGTDAAASQAAAVNAAQLAREPGAVAALLALLEAPPAGTADFYARYHALQALKGLAAAAPGQLQEAVLLAPLGMSRLLGVLGDPSEALRADALLLAAALARGSPDLAQLAAFEGAFDRLFAIIEEEGGAEGGIEVQDCLALLGALLGASPRCRLLFAEGGHLPRLPPLLALPPPGGGGPQPPALPPQRAATLAATLEVVAALLPPPAAGQAAAAGAAAEGSRDALARLGLADAMVELGLEGGGAGDGGVRALALLCLAGLASGNRPQQGRLAAATVAVPSGGGAKVPLLLAAARAAVGSQLLDEAAAADRLLEAYCQDNSAGQAVLASALLASTAPPPDSLAGFLLASIGRHQGGWEEAASAARAAGALAHLLAGSPGLQPHLLALQVPAVGDANGGSNDGGSLMEALAALLGALVTRHGRRPAAAAAAVAVLRLLLLWLQACPPAVTAFLRAVARSQPFLIDSIRGSNACSGAAASAHPVSRGMLAALLGTCAVHAEDAPGTPSAAQLLGAIDAQIGRDSFLGILEAMLQHPAVAAAAAAVGVAALGGGGPSLSPASAAFLASLAAEVRQRVAGPAEAPQAAAAAASAGGGASGAHPPAASPDSLPLRAWVPPPTAATADESPAAPPASGTRQEDAAAPPAAAKLASPLAAAPAPPNGFGPAAQEALESENRRLQAELAALRSQRALAGDGAAAEAAEALRAAAEAEAAAERARGDAAAAQAAARKLEADLQDLSAAYSTLDAHAADLQQQVDSLLQQLAAGGGGGGGMERAVEAAGAEAAAEAEEAMADLLVCLGQEEAKVARLRERLEAMGVDCDALLADIVAAGEEGAGADDDLT